MFRVEVRLEDFKYRFAGLRGAKRRAIMKKAIRAACKPLRLAARAAAPSGPKGPAHVQGILRRSISTVIKEKNSVVWGFVGPRSDYSVSIPSKKHGEIKYRPARIVHIAERGSKRQAGTHFLENVNEQQKANTIRIMQDVIGNEVKKAVG